MTPGPRDVVCAVVLAGGRSRRMGRDKAALPWRGSTMLATVVGTLRTRLDTVIVVGAAGQALPALDGDGAVTVVTDTIPGQGPLRGLEAGLMAAEERGHRWAFVAATDMPLLTGDVVGELCIAAVSDASLDVVVASVDGADQPLAAVYRTALGRRIDDVLAGGTSSLRGFLDPLRVRRVVLDGSRAGAVANANTPADVERFSRPGL